MSELVVLRLVSGETLMGELTYDNEEFVFVKNPISVRYVPSTRDGVLAEKTVAMPYCSLTEETEYTFMRQHVVFLKALKPSIGEYYMELMREYEKDESEVEMEHLEEEDDFDEEDEIEDVPKKPKTFH